MCAYPIPEITLELEHWEHFKLHAVFVQEVFVIKTCQAFTQGAHP